MAHRWNQDVQYSHGYLVPVFAVSLLWFRRTAIQDLPLHRNWRGLLLILSGILLRIAGTLIYSEWVDNISLLPMLMGIAVLWGGWPALKWSLSGILFLFFMIPLPYTLDVALTVPLRTIGTTASTYLLQTFGISAFAEGNIISAGDHQIGVAEACSGLRMTMIFFALSTAVALTIRRTVLERMVVISSAVPIALVVNIARITATGLFHATGNEMLAGWFFSRPGRVAHDAPGAGALAMRAVLPAASVHRGT